MPDDIQVADATTIRDSIDESLPSIDGLQIELGGVYFAEFETPSAEAIGLAFAIIILIVAFGSVLAMGLPIGVALAGIGLGTSLVIIASNVAPVPETGQFVGVMIGLGVGIDYALLIVTRCREQMHMGHTVRESVVTAIDTAGRSVVFAGGTVVISLLGMLVMNVAFVTGLALSAVLVVLVTIVASLTLLPALLGFAGDNVERTRWRGLIAAGLVAVALFGAGIGLNVRSLLVRAARAILVLIVGIWSAGAQGGGEAPSPEAAARHAGLPVEPRHPAPPVAGRDRLGDRPADPRHPAARHAARLRRREQLSRRQLARGRPTTCSSRASASGSTVRCCSSPNCPPGSTSRSWGPSPTPSPRPRASPSCRRRRSARTARSVQWLVVPTTGPQDEATTQLVNRLRDDVLPSVEASTGLDINATGAVAINVDFSNYLAERLPYFFLAVLTLSFLLLMIVFRSLLVPLKAVIMNLLTIGAAYGVVVALFQWGWLGDVTNVSPAPIETWIPMMLFAITFGLSMDYEVFLLSRIQEEYRRTGDSRDVGCRRSRGDGQGHHRGGGDHGRRVRQLPPRERPGAEDHGRRSGDRDPPRRDDRPPGARALDDGVAGRQELVAATLARPHPAAPERGRRTVPPMEEEREPVLVSSE